MDKLGKSIGQVGCSPLENHLERQNVGAAPPVYTTNDVPPTPPTGLPHISPPGSVILALPAQPRDKGIPLMKNRKSISKIGSSSPDNLLKKQQNVSSRNNVPLTPSSRHPEIPPPGSVILALPTQPRNKGVPLMGKGKSTTKVGSSSSDKHSKKQQNVNSRNNIVPPTRPAALPKIPPPGSVILALPAQPQNKGNSLTKKRKSNAKVDCSSSDIHLKGKQNVSSSSNVPPTLPADIPEIPPPGSVISFLPAQPQEVIIISSSDDEMDEDGETFTLNVDDLFEGLTDEDLAHIMDLIEPEEDIRVMDEDNTGLNADVASGTLRRRIFDERELPPSNWRDSCMICEEPYLNGQELGQFSCGHEFHANCAVQRVTNGNICPICLTSIL